MNDEARDEQSQGVTLGDIYFVLFRRKWIILFFIVMAVLAFASVCALKPPRYRCDAKLFIRYVENRSLNPPGEASRHAGIAIRKALM